MAVLENMPDQYTVGMYKGTIDFYWYMGLPVARKWPSPPSRPRSAAVQEQWPIFSAASRAWLNTDDESRAAMERMSSGSSMSGRDLAAKLYINGRNVVRVE